MAAEKQGLLHKALAATDAQNVHPVLSAALFSHATRTNGGATMDASSGALRPIGGPGYSVGGASGRAGMRIPTMHLPLNQGEADPPLDRVLSARRQIRNDAPNGDRAMGSWDARMSDHPRNEVDVDAVDVMQGRRQAKRAGQRRGEDGIFALPRGKNISTMRKMPTGH
jgi:hypothetical protein